MRSSILLIALLGACSPSGNVNPEVFRREYDAAAAVTAPTHKLGELVFRVGPVPQNVCTSSLGCAAHHRKVSYVFGHSHVIYVPRIPPRSCDAKRALWYVYLVIHEINHAFGYRHGAEMDLAVDEGMDWYITHNCAAEELENAE